MADDSSAAGADSIHRLQVLIAADVERLARRRAELADMGDLLISLRAQLGDLTQLGSPLGVEMLEQELAAPVVDRLAGRVERIDNVLLDAVVGAGAEEQHRSHELERAAQGQRQRTIYGEHLFAVPEVVGRIDGLAAAGQQQRGSTELEHEFAVFGEEAVVTPSVWGDPGSSYLVVRHPVLIAAFTAWFELTWQVCAPRADSAPLDERLVTLLARGYKDEAIARQLGVSLRTVRRRVASLMDHYGVGTRFQLGAELVREGVL